jgi:glutathione synthase
MRSLFVMDPLERINVRGDSTYVTMRECCDRGHPVAYCTPDQLYGLNGRARATVTWVKVTEAPPYFTPLHTEDVALEGFDVVWMRKDPPFDMRYVFSTYLLDMANTLVVNAPAGIKLFTEKVWAQIRFPHFQPPTLISNDLRRIRAFAEEHGRIVLKPWDGNGGRGVLVSEPGDKNLSSMIDLLTAEGRDHLLCQRYIPGVVKGDKRILLFDGEPVGAILRVPTGADHRANMHVGATVEATELTDRERQICAELGPELKAHGQLLVGIDVIDGWLTEINVTSPTGLQECNRLYGRKLEAELIDLVEQKARRD